MSQTSDEMRSFLSDAGILAETLPFETCMIVMPTFRLRSGRVALLLQQNGVRCRALGHGTGEVRDARGRREQIRGILFLAIHRADARLAELYSRLYGVCAFTVEATAKSAVD